MGERVLQSCVFWLYARFSHSVEGHAWGGTLTWHAAWRTFVIMTSVAGLQHEIGEI